jgi:2,4-dienoyl-CoA reductase-like NADH-dependent reductase (Old Yellow Enzyme family)
VETHPALEPIVLRHTTLVSRVVFTAHTASLSEGGIPGERTAAYYEARAAGGAGLIVMEPIPVLPNGGVTPQNYNPAHPEFGSALAAVAARVKQHGTVFVSQLYHMGTNADPYSPDSERWGPSAMSGPGWADTTRAIDDEDIALLTAAFARVAALTVANGSDGVECMFAYDTLVDQFMDPKRNQRTDEYGGGLANRCRLAVDVLQAVRAAIGPDRILGVTITAAMAEHLDAIRYLCEHVDIDYVGVGNGNYESLHLTIAPMEVPVAIGRSIASPVRVALSSLPKPPLVIAEGRIRDLATASATVEGGEADLVGMTRALIADPELLIKSRRGDADRVRPCVAYNLCIARRLRKYPIACVQNPTAGEEHGGGLLPAAQSKSVLVVGAGLAGLEAARVCAERGHRVRVVEQGSHAGGQARLIATMPLQTGFAELIDWRMSELAHLGVTVEFGVRADRSFIEAAGPDHVIVATGSAPADVYGTVSSVDILSTPERWLPAGATVIVLDADGHRKGIGTAEWIAARGHSTTLVPLGIPVAYLLDGLKVGPLAVARIRDLGVELVEGYRLAGVIEDGVSLARVYDRSSLHLSADVIVNAGAHSACDELVSVARSLSISVRAIGDARSPRLVEDAIRDGYSHAATV